MSWASLASNQGVTFNNLQDGVNTGQFTAKTTIPATNQLVSKSAANTYVNIDTSYAPYASKASNQLVVKSDLITTTTTTTTAIPSYAYYFDNTSYSTGNDACNNFTSSIVLYAASSNPASVSRFFTDAGLTTPYTGNGNYYAWSPDNISNYVGTVDSSGFTSSVSTCP